MPKLENKDVVVFWLKRQITRIEEAVKPPSQEAMAQQRMTYADRQQAVTEAEKQTEVRRVELASLQAALRFIEENG